ncbi:MAG: SCO family protein [Gemmatimonadetes bacterium]|nr:SCO family protein [Gemmatimonadota bacterium]
MRLHRLLVLVAPAALGAAAWSSAPAHAVAVGASGGPVGSVVAAVREALGWPARVVSAGDARLGSASGRVTLSGAPFTGELVMRDDSGRVRERAGFRDGLLDGLQRRWHADGVLAERRTWRAGNKVGTHEGWWPNGQRQFTCTYEGGLAEGTCTDWHANGQVATVHAYVHGEESGPQQGWSADGNLQFNYVRRDGHRYGVLGQVRCKQLPVYRDSTLTPEWTRDPAGIHQVGDFALTDQAGATVTPADLEGKVTVVTFFYATCRDLCPKLRSRLAELRRQFAGDDRVQLVSI